MSKGGGDQEADPRVPGEGSDEDEIFCSTLSRNKDKCMNGATNGPRLACRKTCVFAAEKSVPTEAEKRSIPCESHESLCGSGGISPLLLIFGNRCQ